MLLWVVGGRRPLKVTGTFHATQTLAPNYADNTLAVMEFEGGGLGIIDISLREHGGHRRFEVFGAGPAVAAFHCPMLDGRYLPPMAPIREPLPGQPCHWHVLAARSMLRCLPSVIP